MNTSERLKRIMEAKGFNLKTFAEQADIPYRTLQNYILSGREPNAEALMKLYSRLGVNLNWLMSGEGEMFSSEIVILHLTQKEQALINHYQAIPEEAKIAFTTLLELLSK
ncbi:MAG: helix-turn-helix domain-containing protein [Pasteurellaceae bacterium]|nr:helix-turn-helix domain-containing protein [Pasteurellaceae bacterium]